MLTSKKTDQACVYKHKREDQKVKGKIKEQNVEVDVIDSVENKAEDLTVPITAPEDLKQMGLMDAPSVIIDRDEENRDVEIFQKTGDLRLLEKVYKNRIPTIRTWANKHYYPGLTHSVEDLFEELSFVFVKAAHKYDKKRGSFNTCLFTFLLNRIKNIKSGKHAKKRISEEYDGPLNGMILSLDYSYDKDGSQTSLKDTIPNPETQEDGHLLKKTCLNETIDALSPNNPIFKNFLIKISGGGSLASLLKEYKTRKGDMKINRVLAKKLDAHSCSKIVKNMIKDQGKIDGEFKLINYQIVRPNVLLYEVEMKKTKETDNIMKTIRDLRRNRNAYISKIKGNYLH